MANYSFFFGIVLATFINVMQGNKAQSIVTFDQNYYAYWGLDHFKLDKTPEEEVQLLIDQSSGSGFKSRLDYQSGFFHIKMKIPQQKTGGIIPNFYLISDFGSTRDELDLEFMGTRGLLQTNIYTDGLGGREQRFQLPFDPSEDFHTYIILWNQHHIVFFVDDIPIREFKNYGTRGVKYPEKAMHMEGTLWSGNWAGQVDWSLGPFIAKYRDFNNITACSPSQYPGSGECYSTRFFWNSPAYSSLNQDQRRSLEKARSSWLVYDYCQTNTASNYPECSIHDNE